MNHYNNRLIQLTVDFANTFDPFLAEPESLQSPADLHMFLANHQMEIGASFGEAELTEVRQLRDRVRGMLLSLEQSDPTAITRSINTLLAENSVITQAVVTSDMEWYLEYGPSNGASHVQRLAVQVGLGLTLALQQYGTERLKVCAASPCQEVFIDVSKNRSRRFCGERCANRYNVAHFRERQRPDRD